MGAFKFAKAIEVFFTFACGSIIGHIQIPPGVVIVDTVPSMAGGWPVIGCAVYNIAGDILATAEGSEEVGEIVADTFMGT